MVGRDGFEPSKTLVDGFTVRSIWPLCNLPVLNKSLLANKIIKLTANKHLLELVIGIEPTTY